MKLFFQRMGEGKPLIILHGLFGLSDNWYTMGKKLSEHYRVYLPDLRNHGRSPHADDMNYELMAEDVRELIRDENIGSPLIVGHSMGGKTAMQLALDNPDLPAGLIVVDITSARYPMYHRHLIGSMKNVPLAELKERRETDAYLKKFIPDPPVIQLMMKNILRKEDGSFAWKFDLGAIENNLGALHDEITAERTFEKKVLLLKGEKSEYVNEEMLLQTKRLFPKLYVKEINGAGHWVHADRPEETLEEILNFCGKTMN